MDKAQAAATRRKVFGMIAADKIAFLGYHMPFAAVGFVETYGTAIASFRRPISSTCEVAAWQPYQARRTCRAFCYSLPVIDVLPALANFQSNPCTPPVRTIRSGRRCIFLN
ncbi:hypothetical protein ATY81_11835 [Rhizobium sp. R72]|nr:hypothetical protein ATY81_11835 [Rhizobium sp. R72]OWV95222.1 hypothetical protein ATY80_11835 [Rhizobium sp. R711]